MPLRKQNNKESLGLVSSHLKSKLIQRSKEIVGGFILLLLIVLQSAASLPNARVVANDNSAVNQRATLPPEWTATFTSLPATVMVRTPLPTLTLGGQSPTGVPFSAASSVNNGKQVIIDVDFLALHTSTSEKASVIEIAPRGSVKTILIETQSPSDNRTWYYVADGYGWVPSIVNNAVTTRDYSPQIWKQMIAETDNQLKANPQNPALKLQKGLLYYGQQEYDKAVSEISDAIMIMEGIASADQKEYARFYDYRGKAYIKLHDYDNASKDFSQALVLGLQDAVVYDHRAMARQELGQYQFAASDFSESIRLDPNYGLLYYNMAVLIEKVEHNDPAQLDYLNKAIQIDPYFPYAYANRGYYYTQIGDYSDHVLNDFSTALNLVPHDKITLLDRGSLYLDRQQFNLAVADFSRVIALYPDDSTAYSNRGAAYSFMGDFKAALADLIVAVKLGDTTGLAYYNLGTIYMDLGQHKAALYCFNKALEINPYRNDARINRANILQRFGGLDEEEIMSYSSFELLITPTP